MVVVFACEASGLKNAFVVVHTNRFGQILGVYTLQASSESLKASVFLLLTYGSASTLIIQSQIVAIIGLQRLINNRLIDS